MPKIISSTHIKDSADTIFNILTNMGSFSKFISGVKEVKVLFSDNAKRISEWEIELGGTSVKWKEEQVVNQQNRFITFRMIDGDYSNYDGQWKVTQNDSGSIVELKFNIDWDFDGENLKFSEILEKRAKFASKWVLRELRRNIEKGKQNLNHGDLDQKIISEVFEFVNLTGMKIIGFYDHLPRNVSTEFEKHFFIVMPGYGETKKDSLLISYYLVRNGFNVIRYDATNHVGESDGNVFNTTMEGLKRDLIDSISYVCQRFNLRMVGIVATSLSARAAIKAISEDRRVSCFISLVGVVNLQDTLERIYREDIIGDVTNGKIKPSYEVLGYVIDQKFPVEAVKYRYHDLSSTIRDIDNCKCPITLFYAEKDVWISHDDIKKITEKTTQSLFEVKLIPNSMHLIMENPRVLKNTLKDIAVTANRLLNNKDIYLEDVIEPSRAELVIQSRIEKDRLRLKSNLSQEDEVEFWDSYLHKFTILSKVPDYESYLVLLINMLKLQGEGTLKILDAGCGNGYLGAAIILNRVAPLFLEKKPKLDDFSPNFEYFAIDRAQSTLNIAKRGHKQIAESRIPGYFSKKVLDFFSYSVGDLNSHLAFKDNYFDRICCSLVLSYLEKPHASLAELIRVLRPGGSIVLSSMKPSADMSQIYRNFLSVCQDPKELQAARELLNEAGKIKQKEGIGFYHFYSDKELKTIFFAAGLTHIKVYRSFGEQANVIIGQKK